MRMQQEREGWVSLVEEQEYLPVEAVSNYNRSGKLVDEFMRIGLLEKKGCDESRCAELRDDEREY